MVSDRFPRFTAAFWSQLFSLETTRLLMPSLRLPMGLPDISTLGRGGKPDELASSDSAPSTTSRPCERGDTAGKVASAEVTAATAWQVIMATLRLCLSLMD
uniref:Uncharacterized protein n=1 Tax=Peronospora matthiolae TaxID=2874970 RepID=A0AAV1UZF4_9STRA